MNERSFYLPTAEWMQRSCSPPECSAGFFRRTASGSAARGERLEARGAGDHPQPVLHVRADAVPHQSRPAVELRRRGREEAAAPEHLAAGVVEPRFAQRAQAGQAARGGEATT